MFESEAIARQLIDEVVEWVHGDQFFQRSCFPSLIDCQNSFVLKDESIWFKEIDINNEESRFVTLNDVVTDITSAYRLIHQFGPEQFQELVGRTTESLCERIGQSDQIRRFSEWMFAQNLLQADWPQFHDQICTTVTTHLGGIIHARAASASTRYVPMETLFTLYKAGLFPFAWDWESFWCLDPTSLMTANE